MKIAILSIGQVNMDVLQTVRRGLDEVFSQTEVVVLQTIMPLPIEAYNSSRRQYHSTRMLVEMHTEVGKIEAQLFLGVTDVDLYVPSMNFVFGEAMLSTKVALISLFRLRPEFYGGPPDSELFLERALKEAVHEIGHTVGLRHCQNPLCVMFFSNSINDTDLKKTKFCENCQKISHKLRPSRCKRFKADSLSG